MPAAGTQRGGAVGEPSPVRAELVCTACATSYAPDPFRLACDLPHAPALLRSRYADSRLTLDPERSDVYRFRAWLPTIRCLEGVAAPVTIHSRALGDLLGLTQLHLSWNGYWPERGARAESATFKEWEAAAALARMPADEGRVLVVASAGNTARAFAQLAARNQLAVCLVVPESALAAVWSREPLGPRVQLVAVAGGDYGDAIALAGAIARLEGFCPEGGVANVARRDGMGTTVLDSATKLGRIPDHYFQAVGSGSGGIAAWEANLRLMADGRFGRQRMRLHLSQAVPWTPIADAWRTRSPTLLPIDERDARRRVARASVPVLTNRTPAYALTGGLFTALQDANAVTYSVTWAETECAAALFERSEGVDVEPAAAVAVASLCQAVRAGRIAPDDVVLLNVTGGGMRRALADVARYRPEPTLVVRASELTPGIVADCAALLRRRSEPRVRPPPSSCRRPTAAARARRPTRASRAGGSGRAD